MDCVIIYYPMILCNSWSSFMGKRSPRCFPQAGHGLAAMILTLLVCIPTFLADTAYAPEELNYCIDGLNHKKEPGPESDLYKECSPWKHRSCCTFDTTYNAHHSNNHGFNFDHCSHVKIMSERCRRHFIQDLCFYECSPNVGPWVVKVPHKQSKERFFEVPLCQIDCDSWFDACRHDYTCAEIWGRNGFQWKNHTNYCKESSTCRTFEEVYNNNAKNFCEKVWDYSWKVLSDDQPCMRMWFNNSMDNPNDRVAWNYVYNVRNNADSHESAFLICSVISVLPFLYFQSQQNL
ncbi:folate receptor beta isoform X1 [Bemisia tabaci]|uniref:folate receptor beta isoform X1 n=2 Tax=Bemisia tabaci TaxID=7038 RepID=UPI003B28A643